MALRIAATSEDYDYFHLIGVFFLQSSPQIDGRMRNTQYRIRFDGRRYAHLKQNRHFCHDGGHKLSA